jgi:hypothetical protein
MKTRVILFIGGLVLAGWSCAGNHHPLKAYIQNADSVSLTFYTTGQGRSNIMIRDKASVNKLREYLGSETTTASPCAETGSMWFYEGPRKKIQVDFGIHPNCSFFSYIMSNKTYTKILTSEAIEYLTGVEQIATGKL